MPEDIELTLDDGSSAWLPKSQIISFAAEGSGTRIEVSNSNGTAGQVNVRESYAEVAEIMNAIIPPEPQGDFME